MTHRSQARFCLFVAMNAVIRAYLSAATLSKANPHPTNTMKEIKAPQFVSDRLATVFLAGSIEMGAAEQWQERVVAMLNGTPWTLLNPRRDDWDNSWEQSMSDSRFVEQVQWELQGIEQAEKVIIYFAPDTKAPITLLELGIASQMKEPKDIYVVCPTPFYRKGNVDIVCDRYQIKQWSTLEDVCAALKRPSL